MIFWFINSQISIAQNRVFEVENFKHEVKIFGFKTGQKIDLKFYRENFHVPHFFPTEFINPKFKNETIAKWNNEEGEKDYNQNWTYTYTYDEYSRVVKYEYSGCHVCSQLPYEVQIKYDENNRPIELIEFYKISKEQNSSNKDNPTLKIYRIEYNEKDEVRKLLSIQSDDLIKRIELTN